MNTFTDKEWGYGDDPPSTFNPTDFDADQIVSAAAAAGMAGLILTCKHHDGFCLWPSKHTEYSVKNSPWRNGEGDVVREISDACRNHGILFGAYLSPWDRNHPDYGTPAYIDYYRAQLQELTTEYGELFEVWFDGANGGDGYYGGAREIRGIDRKTYYDWDNTWAIVRKNQPNAVMFSDGGPDIRWVGNESGFAGDPCWATLSAAKLYPGFGGDAPEERLDSDDMVKAWASDGEMLSTGDPDGDCWIPAECDVSIRPGWFHHDSENDKTRTPENLLDLYFKSVGRGASFLLNLPPDKRGVLHENDVAALRGFSRLVNDIFSSDLAKSAVCASSSKRNGPGSFEPSNVVDGSRSTFWSPSADDPTPSVVLDFNASTTFNVVGIREHLPSGQRVREFAVDIYENGEWREYASAESIGNRRLIRGEEITTPKTRLRILKSSGIPEISEFAIHFAKDE
jgi:alpha-L-fucosidase